MRVRRALVAALALLLATAPAAGAQGKPAQKKVLRYGWAQDPQTLNPFVDQDSEDFNVWALNWDLLVDFSPKDLSPVPGIAKSWTVSPDKKTVTFKLFPGRKWSDGRPITSADVKYSLQVLGGNGALFTSYTSNVTSIDTPDANTVVIHTKKPDARIVGGLFIYIIPEHVWGKYSVKTLLGSFKPSMPLVGSGPWVATKFQRNHIIVMDRNPYWRGPRPKFDEIQFIKFGNADAAERALRLGEVDFVREVQASSFARMGKAPHIQTVKAPSPSFTELAFNLCSRKICPDAKFNPAVQDRTVRQAIAYAVDRSRIDAIADRNTSFVAHGILPQYYKAFYQQPGIDYPYDPAKANQMLDAAGYKRGSGGIRAKGKLKLDFDLWVRTESPSNIQAAKLVAEMAGKVGVKFNVKPVSVDKLTEITTQEKNGKRAPDFDTFIWGWGGDPYDPSTLLQLITTSAIAPQTSDSLYSNPAYDKLYNEQVGEFGVAKRRAIISQMLAISQRDLPYLVLTVDPLLQAYRTDRLTNTGRWCPQGTGDLTCDEVSYVPLLTLAPASAKAGGGGGGGGAVFVIVGLVVLAAIAGGVILARRRRRAQEPVELEV
jgi:peptide/nickel transport system substrate-binding protein